MATNQLRQFQTSSKYQEEACKPKINTFAMTLVLAALHSNQPAKEPLELCIRAWRMLSKLRLDHLVARFKAFGIFFANYGYWNILEYCSMSHLAQ